MPVRRRALQLGTALLAVALAAGCGSATSSAPPVTAPGVGTPAATATDLPTSASTPAEVPSQASSADVNGSTELSAWMAAACTATEDTGLSDVFDVEPGSMTSDPKAAAKRLVRLYQQMGQRLRGFADRLEQLGAPAIANGKEFTDGYIAAARAMADQFDAVTGDLPANPTLQQMLAAIGRTDPAEMAQLQRKFASLAELLDTDEIERLAKSVPECKDLID